MLRQCDSMPFEPPSYERDGEENQREKGATMLWKEGLQCKIRYMLPNHQLKGRLTHEKYLNHPFAHQRGHNIIQRGETQPSHLFCTMLSSQLTLTQVMFSVWPTNSYWRIALMRFKTFFKPTQIATNYRSGDGNTWLTIRVLLAKDKCVMLQYVSFPLTLLTSKLSTLAIW